MVTAPRPVAPWVKLSPKLRGTAVADAGVGVAAVPVVNWISSGMRSDSKRPASTLTDKTPLLVTRQSPRTPIELRLLMRGAVWNRYVCRNGVAYDAPVPAAVAL